MALRDPARIIPHSPHSPVWGCQTTEGTSTLNLVQGYMHTALFQKLENGKAS